MGDRAYITITTNNNPLDTITIYGHWAGSSNFQAVQNVIRRTDRVGDTSYLAAQIFYEWAVRLNRYNGETGFGIMTGDCGEEENPTVYVDADTGQITYRGEVLDLRNQTPRKIEI